MLSISIRPSRYSNELIREHHEFTVNLPTVDLVRVTDYCGTVSGRKVDKFAATGLEPVPAKVIETVVIAECPVNIECQVTQILPLGAHDLFLAKIVAVQVDESLLNEAGGVDLSRIALFTYSGMRYWSLGQLLGTHGFSAKT